MIKINKQLEKKERNITTGVVFGGTAAAANCVEGFLFIFTSSESGTLVEISQLELSLVALLLLITA